MNKEIALFYAAILEWLYIKDGQFPSSNIWREQFTKMFASSLLELERKLKGEKYE